MARSGRRRPNPTLEKWTAKLERQLPFAKRLSRALNREACRITDIRPAKRLRQPAFFLRIRPNRSLTERFGLANELLMLAVGTEVEWRDVQAAKDYLSDPKMRVDQDVLLIVDSNPGTLERRLRSLPRQSEHRIPWDLDRHLLEVMTHWMPLYDLFDVRSPVRGRDVIGRRTEIEALRQMVDQGGAIGVLGLRKVGKTTLVRAVTDAIEGRPPPEDHPLRDTYVIWVDASSSSRRQPPGWRAGCWRRCAPSCPRWRSHAGSRWRSSRRSSGGSSRSSSASWCW